MQLTPTEYLELIENLHYVKSAGFKIMVVNGHFSVWKLYPNNRKVMLSTGYSTIEECFAFVDGAHTK
jgi:hypothetical protein